MSRTRSSPRKFSEKIALLNKKEAEHNAEFEKIIKEVELTTRAQSSFPVRTASFSNCYSNSYFTNGDSQPIESDQLTSNYNYNHHNQQLHYSSQNQLYPSPRIVERVRPNIHHNPSPQYQQSQQHQQQHQLEPPATIDPYNHQQQQHHHMQQQPQQHQQQQQEVLTTTDIYIQSNSNSPGVPNIRISPIDDGFGSNQQVNYMLSQSNNCSTSTQAMTNNMSTISSARSLPDIANLRVSNSSPVIGSPIMHQSYSDERLNNNLSPDYYSTSSNIIPESVAQTDLFPSNEMIGDQQQQQQLQQTNTNFQSQDVNYQNPIQDQFQNIHINDNSYQGSPTWQDGYYTTD